MRGPSNWARRGAQAGRRDRRGQPPDPLADGAALDLPAAGHPRRHRARRVARDRLPRARDLGELRGAGGGRGRQEVETELSRGALIFAFAIAIGFALMLFKVTPALITSWLPIDTTGWFVVVEGADPRRASSSLYLLADLAAARPAARLPVPRGRAQGDQRLRGRRGARCPSASSASA